MGRSCHSWTHLFTQPPWDGIKERLLSFGPQVQNKCQFFHNGFSDGSNQEWFLILLSFGTYFNSLLSSQHMLPVFFFFTQRPLIVPAPPHLGGIKAFGGFKYWKDYAGCLPIQNSKSDFIFQSGGISKWADFKVVAFPSELRQISK